MNTSTPSRHAPSTTTQSSPLAANRLGDSIGLRLGGVVALGAITYIHGLDVKSKLDEVPYLGVGYILLMVSCVIAAALLLSPGRTARRFGWQFGATVAALTFIGFVLTRTVGLPNAMDDKGNWGETLGIWSLITEGAMVVMGIVATGLFRSRSAHTAR